MFTVRFQIVYVAATLAVFCTVAFFSRARARRIAGAASAVLVYTAISAPIDELGARGGWWIYPTCTNPAHPPLAVYFGQAMMFVGTIALIGWRVQRRSGARGLVWLTAIVCVGGLVRDLSVGAMLGDVIRFGRMPGSAIADMAAWAVVVTVALLVTRVVAGPARADALRGSPGSGT